mgnify:CR=1 FL=1
MALVQLGYSVNIKEAFTNYLNVDAPGFVPREMTTPVEAVKILKENGAIPVLAHPLLSNTISLGATNLPSEEPNHASRLYSGNIVDFLIHLVEDGQISVDLQDEIVRETLITIDGQILNQKITEILGLDLTSEATERS